MNKVILIGNLGKDVESITTESGMQIAKFSIATGEKSKDGTKHTDWHNIVCFNKTAELCAKYLAKGMKAAIDGKIKTRSFEGKDGNKVYVTEVIANSVTFLDKPKPQDGSSEEAAW